MMTILRVSVCTAALAVAGLSLDLIYPSGLKSFGSDLWSLPELRASMRHELERAECLQERDIAILERLEIKQRIFADLVAERLPLLEAAKKLHELALATPEADRADRRHARFDFQSSEEMNYLCRQVIRYVREGFAPESERAESVVARLETELQRDFDQAGKKPF
jgi:hypothetical protein